MVKTAAYYDKVYTERIIGKSSALVLIEHWANRAANHVEGSVLDLGCGLGVLANKVAGKYVGVDFCKIAIKYAKKHCKNAQAEFVLADILAYVKDVPDDDFSTIVLTEVLEHLEHPQDIIREAKRIACKRIVITVPMNSPNPAHVKHRWSVADLKKLLGPKIEIEDIRGFWLAVWDRGGRPVSLKKKK